MSPTTLHPKRPCTTAWSVWMMVYLCVQEMARKPLSPFSDSPSGVVEAVGDQVTEREYRIERSEQEGNHWHSILGGSWQVCSHG